MTSRESTPSPAASWGRQAAFLGVVFAVAAAVVAGGVGFTNPVSAYSGVEPWSVAALLAFLLLLVGGGVLLAASLTAVPPRRPAPIAVDHDSGVTASAAAGAPTGEPASEDPSSAAAASPPRSAERGRSLTVLGALLGLAGLTVAGLAVILGAVVPGRTEPIMVQFTELSGRVQLEYCPALPGSFTALAARSDLAGSDTVLPVRVTGQTCGNPEFTAGVWIYLNRDAVTVAELP